MKTEVVPTKLTDDISIQIQFIGWQDCGDVMPPYTQFNVLIKGHEKFQSTITAESLLELGLPVPVHPSFEEWQNREGYMSAGIETLISAQNLEKLFGGRNA